MTTGSASLPICSASDAGNARAHFTAGECVSNRTGWLRPGSRKKRMLLTTLFSVHTFPQEKRPRWSITLRSAPSGSIFI